ncbi:hypothetical protein [Sphingomonas elodea]|uniref:hypothetical protein n=1 Tax=Sphingomonas elodea TaxID=179878 RepID=UPI000496F0ED|nr:hypothetical protein [Sphingomonas elodea]
MNELPHRRLASIDTVEAQFSRFYATRLRRVVGARLKACDVLQAYQQTVMQDRRGQSIGYRRLKTLMLSRGHEQFYSNGSFYRDVALFGEDDSQGSCAPPIDFLQSVGTLDLLARLDAIAADLAELRLRIAGSAS